MKTLKQLIKQGKFHYVNKNINDTNFPDDDRRGEVEIIHFDRDIASEEAIKEMNKKGYRPATAYELLEWTKEWNGNNFIIALGQQWLDPNRKGFVLYLCVNAGDRELDLFWFDYRWRRYCRFAFVKKERKILEVGDLKTQILKQLESKLKKIKEILL